MTAARPKSSEVVKPLVTLSTDALPEIRYDALSGRCLIVAAADRPSRGGLTGSLEDVAEWLDAARALVREAEQSGG